MLILSSLSIKLRRNLRKICGYLKNPLFYFLFYSPTFLPRHRDMITQMDTALRENIVTYANHEGFKHVQLVYTMKSDCIKARFFLNGSLVPFPSLSTCSCVFARLRTEASSSRCRNGCSLLQKAVDSCKFTSSVTQTK